MNLIKPKKLTKGDTISIIATSGEINLEKILNAKKYFEQKGFNVVLGSNITKSNNGLAGNDNERLEDLHNAFLDKNINAILCARGGYGALRLVNKIDYSIIQNNPKILCGYSDITILNCMIYKKCNLVSFSGPMAQSDFADNIDTYTEENFFETLTNTTITLTPKKTVEETFSPVEGILFGGNLSTISSLCGIDFIPNEKFIFFTEDINEPAYKIDRYFTQLLNIEKFRKNLTAIVCGDFTGIDNPENLHNTLDELKKELNIPVVQNYPISHTPIKATIPVGGFAKLSTDKLVITNYIFEN